MVLLNGGWVYIALSVPSVAPGVDKCMVGSLPQPAGTFRDPRAAKAEVKLFSNG
jgi:hypothetical protein